MSHTIPKVKVFSTPPCLHCGKGLKYSRGLCRVCHADPDILAKYPTKQRDAARAALADPDKEKTDEMSLSQLEELIERRRQELPDWYVAEEVNKLDTQIERTIVYSPPTPKKKGKKLTAKQKAKNKAASKVYKKKPLRAKLAGKRQGNGKPESKVKSNDNWGWCGSTYNWS